MIEIKRYKHAYGGNYDEMELATDGEWVRWEDVQELLKKQEDNHAHETQLLTERINRLVSKND